MKIAGDAGDLNIFPYQMGKRKVKGVMQVKRDLPFAYIIQFLKRFGLKNPSTTSATLYVFVVKAFMPPADAIIGDIYDQFSTDGKLVVHYATVNAWG